jgi:hypothetical protein
MGVPPFDDTTQEVLVLPPAENASRSSPGDQERLLTWPFAVATWALCPPVVSVVQIWLPENTQAMRLPSCDHCGKSPGPSRRVAWVSVSRTSTLFGEFVSTRRRASGAQLGNRP